MKLFLICSAISLVVVVTGCGLEYKLVPVSGTISLDGKPLPDALILTQPIGSADNTTPGPGSFARTDAEGRFTMELHSDDRKGAVPGECTVKIKEVGEKKASSDDSVSRGEVRSRIPLDYFEGLIQYTIPEGGTDSMDFDLKSERRGR